MLPPKKIKQIQVTSKKTVEVIKVETPNVTDESVVFKTLYSGISHGTELALVNKEIPSFNKMWIEEKKYYGKDGTGTKKYPSKLGYENIGEVIYLGKNVKNISIGDFYWLDAPHQDYTFTNLLDIPNIKINDFENLERFTSLALTRVALAGIHDANPLIGDIAFVSGLGTVGLLTVQLLKLAGVETVIATDPIESRRQLGSVFGAITFNPVDENFIEEFYSNYNGADISIETSGNIQVLNSCIKLAKYCSKVITVSTLRGNGEGLLLAEEYHKNRLNIVSSMSVNGCPHRRYPNWNLERLNATAYHLIKNSFIDTTKFITHRQNFLDAEKAYDAIQNHPEEAVKIIFTY